MPSARQENLILPEPCRKQSHTLNMNLEGEKLK